MNRSRLGTLVLGGLLLAPPALAQEPAPVDPVVAPAAPVAEAQVTPEAPAAPAAVGPPAEAAPLPAAPSPETTGPSTEAPLPDDASQRAEAKRHTLPLPMGTQPAEVEPELPRPALSESRFQLQVVLETAWRTDPSFDLFSDEESSTLGGLAAGYAVISTTEWAVVPEVGWGRLRASREGAFGGGIEESTLVDDRFHAGASVRYALAPFFEPHARASFGVDVANLSVDAPSTPELVQEDVAPFGALGAGFTLHTNPGGLSRRGATRTLLLGLSVEGGYSLVPDLEVSPAPEGDAPRVSTRDVSLGSLSRSGPYLRFGATLRL